MTITLSIPARDMSCISKEILDLKIDKFTVFAGENNSGKTTIIKSLSEHPEIVDKFGKGNILTILADENDPKEIVVKTSTVSKENYFVAKIKPLVKSVLANAEISRGIDTLASQFNGSASKMDLVSFVNKKLNELGITHKKIDIVFDVEKFTEDLLIKNIVKTIVLDSHFLEATSKEIIVDIDEVGSGMKRLIIAILLQYYSNVSLADKFILFFEEPELFLHPKAKKLLFDALLELSSKPNFYVVITTHDPYFIQLSKTQKIYRVFRNSSNGNTEIEDAFLKSRRILLHDSYAETNYCIFGVASEAYYLELFDHLKRKSKKRSYCKFDSEILFPFFSPFGDTKTCDCDCKPKTHKILPITRLRHDIAHGKKSVSGIDLDLAIQKLIEFKWPIS